MYRREAGPLGDPLLAMLQEVSHRGPDSTGVALFEERPQDQMVLEVKVAESWETGNHADRAEKVLAVARGHGKVVRHDLSGALLEIQLSGVGGVGLLCREVEAVGGVTEVFSAGRRVRIIKDVGQAQELGERHHLHGARGTHALGLTRMATESQVDISHSHPFWSRPVPDVALVHNGTITNYHKMRRLMEQEGVHFNTHNDSELAALLVARDLAGGADLEGALRGLLKTLDGTFQIVVATDHQLGMVKDQFCAKPMVVHEGQDVVAFASEEVALRRFLREPVKTRELHAGEVVVWSR
jgi:glutamine phosphoribosylpyrophosphate amidotransferase